MKTKRVFVMIGALCVCALIAGKVLSSEQPVDPFSNFGYYVEHIDELDDNNFEHVCFIAQKYMSDGALKEGYNDGDPMPDYNKAKEYYEKAISIQSDNPMPYRGMAMLSEYAYKNKDDALEYSLKAIDLGWEYYDVYVIAGFILYERGEVEKAKELLVVAKEGMEYNKDSEPDLLESEEYKKVLKILKTGLS